MANQPVWELVAQLGDVNPLEHGGKWLFVDTTFVYPPELELLYVPPESGFSESYLVYRMVLDKCYYTDGVLSDNKYHLDHHAWFADSVTSGLVGAGSSFEDIISQLTSDRPVMRALGYVSLLAYHSPLNFDAYPLELNFEEVEARYNDPRYHAGLEISAMLNDD